MSIYKHSKDCELVIGIVAPVGVNLDDVQNRLQSILEQFRYAFNFIHVSKLAEPYLSSNQSADSELDRLDRAMSNGTKLREKYGRGDFYALLAVNAINSSRAVNGDDAPMPLGRRAHVIRSLKHPDEVETLRNVYGDGFFLLGVSSSIEKRKEYLSDTKGVPDEHLDRLIARDDKEAGNFGQKTSDVFQLADAFVTTDDNFDLSRQLARILDLLFSCPTVSPTPEEYAMFMAYAASLRSADLSRQVGAVIATPSNDIVATGANDVPRFGGGLYWPTDDDQRDYKLKYDSNELEKQEIILKIMRKFEDGSRDDKEVIKAGSLLLKDTGILNITEYGRAVHAEMEAILSAARNGIPIRGGTLYSTTYPCHNCAKHIVAAGIVKVRYVEPYPKSYATKLHPDSIEANGSDSYNKVHFQPFVGIGPRRFVDLFSTTLSSGRNLARKTDGRLIEWKRTSAELRVPMVPLSYLEAEMIALDEFEAVTKPS